MIELELELTHSSPLGEMSIVSFKVLASAQITRMQYSVCASASTNLQGIVS